MYILPKDMNKDTIDIIPYGFEVDIIKDCSSLRNDIADVFNVIDRNSHNYVQTIEKVVVTLTSHFNEKFTHFFFLFFIISVYKIRHGAIEISWL